MPLLTQYVALLARILLQNLEIFVEVLSLYGQQRSLTVSTPLVRRFLEECRIRSCGQHVIFLCYVRWWHSAMQLSCLVLIYLIP